MHSPYYLLNSILKLYYYNFIEFNESSSKIVMMEKLPSCCLSVYSKPCVPFQSSLVLVLTHFISSHLISSFLRPDY